MELETLPIGEQCKYVFTTTNCFNIKRPKGQLLHHGIIIIWLKVLGQLWHAGIDLKVFFFWYHKFSWLRAWMAREWFEYLVHHCFRPFLPCIQNLNIVATFTFLEIYKKYLWLCQILSMQYYSYPSLSLRHAFKNLILCLVAFFSSISLKQIFLYFEIYFLWFCWLYFSDLVK